MLCPDIYVAVQTCIRSKKQNWESYLIERIHAEDMTGSALCGLLPLRGDAARLSVLGGDRHALLVPEAFAHPGLSAMQALIYELQQLNKRVYVRCTVIDYTIYQTFARSHLSSVRADLARGM